MAYVEFMNNPVGRKVGDCAVRAMSKALNMGWESAYIALAINGLQMGDIMSSNSVSGALLRQNGFSKAIIPDRCPYCYTIDDFCRDNSKGIFVLGTGNHLVTAQDGDYYDSWDSGKEVPIYVWYKDVEPKF